MFIADKPATAKSYLDMFDPQEGLDSAELFEFYYSINREVLKFSGIFQYFGIFPNSVWMNKVCFFLVIISGIVIITPQLFAMKSQTIDIGRILEIAGNFLVLFNGICTRIVIIYHRDKIMKQEETWKNLWEKTVSSEELSPLCGYAKKGKMITFLWLCLTFTCAVAYLIAPLIVSVMNNFSTRPHLPYPVNFEIESNLTLFWLYVIQILCTLMICATLSAGDIAILVIILHACGHLKVLQTKLYNIRNHSIMPMKFVSSYNREEIILTEQDMVNNLKDCIQRHQVILNACTDMERYFNGIGLIEAMCATYHICFAAIGIIAVPKERFKFCVYAFCTLYHLFIFCQTPDDLMTESVAVANAAFSLPWYSCSRSVQTNVLIMMQRAHKGCQWTAGKYFQLSLNAYTAIVSKGMSALAVLRTIM